MDGYLTIDVLEFDSPIYPNYHPIPNLFSCIPPGGPVRYVVDLRTMRLASRHSGKSLPFCDFPAIHPRNAMEWYDDFWTLGISSSSGHGRRFFDQLIHWRWSHESPDVFQCAPGFYLGGEPVFVPEPNSSRGVLICQEFHPRTRTSSFLLFDALNVRVGPIARIGMNRLLYSGFHAAFYPQTSDT
jgi:carotenoid cleavage dioxygenase-like enzyme